MSVPVLGPMTLTGFAHGWYFLFLVSGSHTHSGSSRRPDYKRVHARELDVQAVRAVGSSAFLQLTCVTVDTTDEDGKIWCAPRHPDVR
jgi:hypothetical protein